MTTKISAFPVAALLVLSGLPVFGQGPDRSQDLERRIVLTPKEAIALMPAEVVCEPMVEQMSFSDSGRYLLCTRQAIKVAGNSFAKMLAGQGPPPIETSILLWDAKTRESRTLWKAAGEGVRLMDLHWIPGTDVALGLTYENIVAPPPPGAPADVPPRRIERQTLLRVTPGLDRAQVLAQTNEEEHGSLFLHVSTAKSLALLQRTLPPSEPTPGKPPELPKQTLTVIGPDGRLGATVPSAPGFYLFTVGWDADGSPILTGIRQNATGPEGRKQVSFVLNTKTGMTTPYDKPSPPPAVVRQRPKDTLETLGVRLKQGSSSVKEGPTTVPVGTLWAESIESSEQPRVLVSADSAGGQFSPNGEAILFRSQGALLAAPLVRIDKETFAAARETARRMVVLSNAKQLGLAALMYSQDYDETLPTGENINSKLDPYLKNSSLFDGFSYTFPGGALKDIAKPAETELGFVTGPGGRAVIYVDGHVKWRSDK